MKKVIYNTCVADPWVKVAQILNDEYGWKPVYWTGFGEDHSDVVVPQAFPDIVYQSYYEAWRGVFPAEISEKYPESYIDIDFLKKFAVYEVQALKMMDRLDYDRYSFNFMERERHFLNLIKHWTACIRFFKPDVVISAVNPHRVYDYVLYLLCKFYGIKYITFQYTMCSERFYAVTDIFSIGDVFKKDYEFYLSQKQLKIDTLPEEVRTQYQKVMADYSIAAPSYMRTHPVLHKKNSNFLFLAKRLFSTNKFFGKEGLLSKGVSRTVYKNRKYSIENAHFSVWDFALKRRRTFLYNKMMEKYYMSQTSLPDYEVPYIMFFPHYQPEETTSPNGDIFVNQRLCIETLLKHSPENYYVYIKEHPHQFMSHMQGHTSRIKEFYDDLAAYPRVKLIPFEIDSYTLIRHAVAISTVTGTVGWEAMVQQKPVIIFGIIWYEKYTGVLRITDEESASKMMSFIDHFHYDENNLLAYLHAFSKNSVRAYHYPGEKERLNVSEKECVDSLVQETLNAFNR